MMPKAPEVFTIKKGETIERDSASKRGYDRRWRRAREMFLQSKPLCEECERNDKITAAEVVDHIVPHRGNNKLFWDRKNWQSLCKPCHDSKTARGE